MKTLLTYLISLAVFAAMAASAADAGSLAPAPRVIIKYERDFLERSGSQTLEELLDTGIVTSSPSTCGSERGDRRRSGRGY